MFQQFVALAFACLSLVACGGEVPAEQSSNEVETSKDALVGSYASSAVGATIYSKNVY